MFKGKILSGNRHHSLSCLSGSANQNHEDESSSRVVHRPSYYYYHTNQAPATQLSTTNHQKYYNIHSWLDTVIKTTNNELMAEREYDYPTETETVEKDSLSPTGDDYTCSTHHEQQYPPNIACAKGKSPLVDQKETLSRQEKIKTMKALIMRSEISTRSDRLKRHRLEPTRKDLHCVFKAFRRRAPRSSHTNVDNHQRSAGTANSNEQSVTSIGITARD